MSNHKPYDKYDCFHSLCNAHHLRELEFAFEQENQKWAKQMMDLLLKMKDGTEKSGKLSDSNQTFYLEKYRTILNEGKTECPIVPKEVGKRGRTKKSKSRNLLERLENYEDGVV